ncbi:hypothetical protein ES705_48298 [subsurface metagenome]
MRKSFQLFSFLCITLFLGCQKEEEPTVTSIALDNTTLSLTINSTHKFKVTHTPSNLEAPSYNWTTSNSNIVSVNDEGEITAMSIGEATITVSSLVACGVSHSINSIPLQEGTYTGSYKSVEGDYEDYTYSITLQRDE